MKRSLARFLIAAPIALALFSLASPPQALAQPGPTAPDAQTVKLLLDCNSAANCFESTTALTDWISGTRHPSAAAPLLVEIGPGEFPGGLTCGLGGFMLFQFQPLPAKRFDYVTFRGAGPDVTRIGVHEDVWVGDTWAIGADGCNQLNFEALTADGGTYGVFWQGTGSSRWLDVDAFGQVAWYDFLCPGGSQGPQQKHYVFSSRFESRGGNQGAYVAECGENWIYGSDIVAVGANLPAGSSPAAVVVADQGDVRVFGSTLRVDGSGATNLGGGIGVKVGFPFNGQAPGGGTLHLHGSIVNVSVAGSAGADATGLLMHPNASVPMMAHTAEAAFNLNAGSGGDVRRVSGPDAESPFQWPAGTDLPRPNFSSEDGQDTYIETDCASNGNCNGAGTETHLMIYNEARCTTSKWFDSTTGCCRNELLPACKQ